MTPKEKANELVDRYYWTFGDGYLGEQHIQCALIAVDEIIKSNPIKFDEDDNCIASYWWKEVKQEIEVL
jgi:hypothetical protein